MAIPGNWIERSKLWLVLDRDAAQPRSLGEATQLCIEGGVDAVVFRVKDAPARELLPLAQETQDICRAKGVPFVLSHFVELAYEMGADALHLGSGDGDPAVHSGTRRGAMRLGYSTHSLPEVQWAADSGVNYVFLGPIFETPSKLKYGAPLGTELIAAANELPVPVVLIGGMNERTIPLAVAAGARRVAAISALLAVPDPRAAAARLKALLP